MNKDRVFLLGSRPPEFDGLVDTEFIEPFGHSPVTAAGRPGFKPLDIINPSWEQVTRAVVKMMDCSSVYLGSPGNRQDLWTFFVYIASALDIPEITHAGGAVCLVKAPRIKLPGRPVCSAPEIEHSSVYLCGAVTNNPHHIEDFAYFTRYLHDELPWARIVNPLSLDFPEEVKGMSLEESWPICMRECVRALMGCDYICFIPHYVESSGASFEKAIAGSLLLRQYEPRLVEYRQ